MREKLELTKEQARELIWEDTEGFTVISDEMTSQSRWSIHHCVVVKREADGKYFEGTYSKGATENQDESPFEYEEPNFLQVWPKEKTVIEYVSKEPAQ